MQRELGGRGERRKMTADVLFAMPALLMCLITLIMIILDVLMPSMSDSQYILYPLLYRIQLILSVIAIGTAIVLRYRKHPDTDISETRSALRGNRRNLMVDPSILFFAGFLVCMVVSTCINGLTDYAVTGIKYRCIGIFDIAAFILIYFLGTMQVTSERIRMAVLHAFLAVADTLGIIFLYDWFIGGLSIEAFLNKNEPGAIFFHGNHYGYFLVVAIMVAAGYCIYGTGKMLAAGACSMAVNLMALAVNRSMGCILSVVAVLAVYALIVLIFQRKFARRVIVMLAVLAIMSLAAVIGSVAIRDDIVLLAREVVRILSGRSSGLEGHGRLELWGATIEYIRERPLAGYGCEGIRDMMLEELGVSSPHNETMTYAAFFGIPAAVLYIAGVISILVCSVRTVSKTAVQDAGSTDQDSAPREAVSCGIAGMGAAGYWVSSMFGVGMFYTVPFLFIMLGLSTAGSIDR